jgi:VWFA-related protein
MVGVNAMRSTIIRRGKMLLAGLLAGALSAGAQEVPKTKGAEEKPPGGAAVSVAADVTAVRFNAQVRDRRGNLVTGLPREAFEVREDGRPQDLIYFETDSSPVSVALLVEFSRPTSGILSEMRDSAHLLLRNLDPSDYAALLVFNNRPQVVVDFTKDRDEILNAVARMNYTTRSGIALLDSVRFAVSRMSEVPGKKGIVVLASGLNEIGGRLDELTRQLPVMGVPVYTVSMGQYARNVLNPQMTASDSHIFFQADHRLRTLAESSGGSAFFPSHPNAFPKTMETVSMYLKHQYLLAYDPPDPDDHKRKRALAIAAHADLDRDGAPEPLDVVHVRQYVLGKTAGKP